VLLFAPTTGKLDPRKSGEARRYTALCGGSEVKFYEGAIQIIVAEVGSGETSGAAATPGSELCFPSRTSRFDFFETAIFLLNKIPCKGINRPSVCFGFF
jgi:hypothetical protein